MVLLLFHESIPYKLLKLLKFIYQKVIYFIETVTECVYIFMVMFIMHSISQYGQHENFI